MHHPLLPNVIDLLGANVLLQRRCNWMRLTNWVLLTCNTVLRSVKTGISDFININNDQPEFTSINAFSSSTNFAFQWNLFMAPSLIVSLWLLFFILRFLAFLLLFLLSNWIFYLCNCFYMYRNKSQNSIVCAINCTWDCLRLMLSAHWGNLLKLTNDINQAKKRH